LKRISDDLTKTRQSGNVPFRTHFPVVRNHHWSYGNDLRRNLRQRNVWVTRNNGPGTGPLKCGATTCDRWVKVLLLLPVHQEGLVYVTLNDSEWTILPLMHTKARIMENLGGDPRNLLMNQQNIIVRRQSESLHSCIWEQSWTPNVTMDGGNNWKSIPR